MLFFMSLILVALFLAAYVWAWSRDSVEESRRHCDGMVTTKKKEKTIGFRPLLYCLFFMQS